MPPAASRHPRCQCPRFSAWLPLLLLGLLSLEAAARTLVLRMEELEMPGGWELQTDSGMNRGARRFLIAPSATTEQAPAVGALALPHAGRWRVWVRSRDFAHIRPGTRYFSLRLGTQRLERRFGTHGQEGQDGWAWEDGGTIDVATPGPLLVVLGETARHTARCEALVLTDNLSYTPEGPTWLLQKEAATTVPLQLSGASQQQFSPAPLRGISPQPQATLENEYLRLTFHAGTVEPSAPASAILQPDPKNHAKAPTVVKRTEVGMRVATRPGREAAWAPCTALEQAGTAGYRVLMRPLPSDPALNAGRVYPTWDTSLSPPVQVVLGEARVTTRLGPSTVPWLAGLCTAQRPNAAQQVDAHTVQLTFAPTPQGQLEVVWTLHPGRHDAAVSMTFRPKTPGHYSLGLHSPVAATTAEAEAWLLPFQFHQRRFPDHPALLLSSTTPTPLSLLTSGGTTTGLLVEPEDLPTAGWLRADQSRHALGLRNEHGFVQPQLYGPVLGLPGSRIDTVAAGTHLTTRLRFWARTGDWYGSYRAVVDDLLHLRDYREPTPTTSLSDTAYRVLDLLRQHQPSGWDARAKGSVQIESRNVVTQASPLTYLSLYLLTGDRTLYDTLARPSLEYLLSRPQAHFAVERDIGDNYYRHQPMQGPVQLYGAATYAAAYQMTHGRSPALATLALTPQQQPRRTPPNGHGQLFDDALALHQATGEARWLELARTEALRYLDAQAASHTTAPQEPGDRHFVNVSYAPNWEGLLHLYAATGDARLLAAAQEGARALLTTLWTYPQVPPTDQQPPAQTTLNPGGLYDHARSIWWWGNLRKRVGLYEGPPVEGPIDTPAPHLPQHDVPTWLISNVGLGLEHPFTYVRKEGQANILMSVWAPNLLRLAQFTGDTAFRTAARNAMLGRFATYPGYYLDGQTDAFMQPTYAQQGPDVTSLYVHHIAPFLASVLDYLWTDVEVRSAGAVRFPTTRQMGYVWFDSRLWGHAPGQVYGMSAWPWLNRNAARCHTHQVDLLLAHGEQRVHLILLNQSHQPQRARLSLSRTVLGTLPATATLHEDTQHQRPVPLEGESLSLDLPGNALRVLTLQGVAVDVPTHRTAPPATSALPAAAVSGIDTRPLLPAGAPGTTAKPHWHARASLLQVPPFEWQDLHVYINATWGDLKTATLFYRTTPNGPEQQLRVDQFPFEFSLSLPATTAPHTIWRLQAETSDGTLLQTPEP